MYFGGLLAYDESDTKNSKVYYILYQNRNVHLFVSGILWTVFSKNVGALISSEQSYRYHRVNFCGARHCFYPHIRRLCCRQKEKQRGHYSVFLAALITDFITYIQLCIMVKQFPNFGILLLIIVLHYIIAFVFNRFGISFILKINPPEKCVIFYDPAITPLDIYLKKMSSIKKQ